MENTTDNVIPMGATKYIIAIRAFDDVLKTEKTEIFGFRSKKQRDSVAEICKQNDIEYVTAEDPNAPVPATKAKSRKK